jgi:imidazolonepropionase-like amidohydrolase
MNEALGILIFKNAVILDGTGADPVQGGTVVIEKERIKEVLAGGPGRLPAGAQVVDCNGQTLLPGLIDAHVHICAVEADLTELKRRNYPSVTAVRTLKVLEDCLAQGFTTVRDMGGADPGFRIALEQSLVPGPRIQVAGKGLSQTGGHGDSRLPTETWSPIAYPIGMGGTIADGVDACRRAAREQLRKGVDFIKVMAGGGCMSPTDEIDTTQYSLEELRAVVWEAESAGTYVAAHCYSDQSIINCVTAGVRTIEHGNLGTEKAARAIKEAGACLVPTIVTYEIMAEMGVELGVPEIYLRKMLQARNHGMQALEAAWRVGCTIGSGSDCLGPMQLFKGRELEIQARVMGPMGAIVAATKTNAQILRREKDIGTIEAGKLADLILLDGDPLTDIRLFQNYLERITIILQGGRFYKNLLS